MILDFTLLGEAVSKANSRRLASFGQKEIVIGDKVVGTKPLLRSIKSEKALDFETVAYQIPTYAQLRLAGPVSVTAILYYASNRPDLDESLLLDILQDKYRTVGKGKGAQRYLWRPGVYKNDRQVKVKNIMHGGVSDRPRAEVRIEELFMWKAEIPGFLTVEQQAAKEVEFRKQVRADAPQF